MKHPLRTLINILFILLLLTVFISCESLEPTAKESVVTEVGVQEPEIIEKSEPVVLSQPEEKAPIVEEKSPEIQDSATTPEEIDPALPIEEEPAAQVEESPQPEVQEQEVIEEEAPAIAEEVSVSHLYILHTNDTHGRVVENDQVIGFSKISTIIDMYEDRADNVLVLDAGDAFHGSSLATLVQGESIASILNQVGYDAIAAGNHDFNYGKDRLVELNEMTDFPILSANTYNEAGESILPPYTLFTFDNFTVGVFGLTSTATYQKTHPDNIAGLTFADTVETATAMVEELQPQADIIIALAHLGIDGNSTDTSKRIAEEVTGIDLIIDGLSHTTLPVGLRVNDTLIVQTGYFDKNLGAVDITMEGSRLVAMSAQLYSKEDVITQDIVADPDILTLVDEIIFDQELLKSQAIAFTENVLDGEPEQTRTRPTNLSRIITAAMIEATGADCSIITGSRINTSIGLGEITIGEILSVLPFDDSCVVIELTGQELYDAVEHGLSKAPESNEAYCQLGNLVALYNVFEEPGNRVYKLKIDGETIDKELTYRVAISDFLASGGDGYTVFEGKELHEEIGTIADMVIDYMKQYLPITE